MGGGTEINYPSLLFFILQIYDLSVDALSPTFYFLLPSSKIRDVTFLFNEEGRNIIVIMSSAGYIYTQLMEEASSAQQGPFYVTNVLEINHEDLKVRAYVIISFCSRGSLITHWLFFFYYSFFLRTSNFLRSNVTELIQLRVTLFWVSL